LKSRGRSDTVRPVSVSPLPAPVPDSVPPPSPSTLKHELWAALVLAAVAIAALAFAPHPHPTTETIGSMRSALQPWSVLPFAGLLAAIALLPLFAAHWWEHNRNKALITGVLSVPVALWLIFQFGSAGGFELFEKAREYVSFLCLLGALYVISGGIYVRGSLDGSPAFNTLLLGMGAVLASLIGTTGASMLLIRPLLRANAPREAKAHIVVFFIFVVSNCGGLLTPLGDPPLFLGFLKGVPFEWTVQHLWPIWILINGALLAIFAVLDKVIFEREEARRPGDQHAEVKQHAPFGLDGALNLVVLLGVVAVVFASGRGLFFGGGVWPFGLQEALMVALATASYRMTARKVHDENHFTFGPVIEVAVLFAGIFVTMVPALLLLNVHAPALGIREPWQFFWSTGVLSSFLDNAPTYLTMSAAAAGLHGVPTEGRFLETLLQQGGAEAILIAISAGAVLMGANTYIGNGPNFMVKAVAEQRGVKMPSFFGYLGWSCGVLIPLFAVVTLLFFRS